MSRRTEKRNMVNIINLMSCMRILGKTHMAFRAESDQE